MRPVLPGSPLASFVQWPPACVGGGEERVGVLGVEHEVHAAGAAVELQRVLPALAAVGGLEDAALGVLAPQVPEGADVRRVRILRVHHEARDVVGLGGAEVLPALAGVGGAVDAVPPGGAVAAVPLAAPEPNDLGLRRGDRHRADRRDRLVFEHEPPGGPIVGGLEEPAGAERDVERGRVGGVPRDVADPAAHVGRPDRSPAEAPQLVGLHRRFARGYPGGLLCGPGCLLRGLRGAGHGGCDANCHECNGEGRLHGHLRCAFEARMLTPGRSGMLRRGGPRFRCDCQCVP
jgi:hypothetical protein